MRPYVYLFYAAFAYLIGLANIAYIVGFLAGFGVPKSIGDGDPVHLWYALSIDIGLILAFGALHSITARRSFKRWWTRFIPTPIERATYLYMTAIATALLVFFWQPIPVEIWRIEQIWARVSIFGVYIATWAMMFSATFHFGHFGFFGIAQAWRNFRARGPAKEALTARYLYAFVRHPISLGWMITPLILPEVTVGHLVFAGSTIVYILIATPFEEADLVAELGDEYRRYKENVPAFVPRVDNIIRTVSAQTSDHTEHNSGEAS